MKAERNVPRTHFEAHFSWGWRRPTRSQSNGVVIRKAPCLHPKTPRERSPGVFSQIGTSIVKKQKERALSLPGKPPAPYNSRDFSLRFGSGSPLPRINAWCNGYLWMLVRVCHQINWLVNPDWHSDTRHAWRPWAAVWSCVLYVSSSLTLECFLHSAQFTWSRNPLCIR